MDELGILLAVARWGTMPLWLQIVITVFVIGAMAIAINAICELCKKTLGACGRIQEKIEQRRNQGPFSIRRDGPILLISIVIICTLVGAILHQGAYANKEDLRTQAIQLSNDIFNFSGNRSAEEAREISNFDNFIPGNISNNENQWIENGKRRRAFETDTVKIFNAKYLYQVFVIRNKFQDRGLTDESLDYDIYSVASYDYPDVRAINDIAKKLKELASKLP